MELFHLDGRVVEDDKEFLIQTVNDAKQGVIKTSLFMNGEFLDASILPYAGQSDEQAILKMLKSSHNEKKSELEYLLKNYKEALQANQPEEICRLGSVFFYRRIYQKACQLFQTAVKLRHEYHEAYYFLSQTELALNHPDLAIKAGLKAIELRPQFADYRNNLGEAYLAAASCKPAVIEFEEAIKQNIYYADAYFNLGLAHILNAINKEDFKLCDDLTARTMDLLNKAILVSPGFKTANYDDAVSALSNGDLKRAYTLLKSIRDEKKEKHRQEKAGYLHRFLMSADWILEGSIIDRINFLENAIDKNPGYIDLYYELGLCHLQQSKFNWQKGVDLFKKALEINPKLMKFQRCLDLSEEHYLRLADTIVDIASKEN